MRENEKEAVAGQVRRQEEMSGKEEQPQERSVTRSELGRAESAPLLVIHEQPPGFLFLLRRQEERILLFRCVVVE